jgi:hypothetical protein
MALKLLGNDHDLAGCQGFVTQGTDVRKLIDARRHASALAPLVPIGALARYDRPPPSLTDYDDLLTGSPS